MATALTLWAVAAIYTSTMTVAPISLDTEEHFQEKQRYRRRQEEEEEDVKEEPETSAEAEESTSFERKYGNERSDEDETETETEARRRRGGGGVKREPQLGGPRIKREEFDYDEGDFDTEEEEMRLRSMESLQAKDAADLAEAIRQSRMRDLLEARRMGGAGPSNVPEGGLIEIVDPTAPISPEELSEIQLSRRVLDRLDEETEEDTDVGSSRPSSRSAVGARAAAAGGNGGETDPWEDLEGESGGGSGESAVEAGRVGNEVVNEKMTRMISMKARSAALPLQAAGQCVRSALLLLLVPLRPALLIHLSSRLLYLAQSHPKKACFDKANHSFSNLYMLCVCAYG